MNQTKTLKWWQIVSLVLLFISFLGMGLIPVIIIFRLEEAYSRISLLLLTGGMGLLFLWLLIIIPFTTEKPFIPDDVADPVMRREKLEWNLGLYGFYILFCGVSINLVHTILFSEGKVPSNWLLYFFILWVGSALVMWSPWVRDRIDRYYTENTSACVESNRLRNRPFT